jgi:Ca2+-binding EF-hand superfamily protein
MGRRFLPPLLAVLITIAALPCHADMSSEEQAKRWFAEHDRDHVGYVTAEEVVAYELKRFKRIDVTGDGKVSLGEFCSGVPSGQFEEVSRCRGLFIRMDRDGDGFVTRDELSAYYRDVIRRADQKGDGRVTLQEWLASEQEQ